MELELVAKKCAEKIRQNEHISNKMLEFFFTHEDKYILGTTRQAAVCLEICRNMGIDIKGLIHWEYSDTRDNRKGYWKELVDNIEIFSAEDICNVSKNPYVLMAVGGSNYLKAEKILSDHMIKHVYRCEWDSNSYLRKICYEVYKDEYDSWRGKTKLD